MSLAENKLNMLLCNAGEYRNLESYLHSFASVGMLTRIISWSWSAAEDNTRESRAASVCEWPVLDVMRDWTPLLDAHDVQARAAVLAALRKADRMSDLARLMWLVEDLIYDDLLKGTGWGRRRGWYREQLESCRTIAQVCEAIQSISLISCT